MILDEIPPPCPDCGADVDEQTNFSCEDCGKRGLCDECSTSPIIYDEDKIICRECWNEANYPNDFTYLSGGAHVEGCDGDCALKADYPVTYLNPCRVPNSEER